jgi:UDP-N-acetylmuramate--alanine ligase
MDKFAQALGENADVVYLTDIYLAREQPLPGVTSAVLAERVRAQNPSLPVVHVPDKANLPAHLVQEVGSGDLVLTLGAGDIRAAGTGLLETLNNGTAGETSRAAS